MNTLETLQDILVAKFALTREQVAPDATLTALGIDSLSVLELLFDIEDRFHLKITGDTPRDLATIADVVAYIDGLLVGSAANAEEMSAGPAALPRCAV